MNTTSQTAAGRSFRDLQTDLQPLWGDVTIGQGPDVDVLVVPSLSLERGQMAQIKGAHLYEERQLFSLIRLRDPGVRMVYATSKPLADLVVDAVLELLPGVPASHARRRLHLLDTDDASDRPLTEKLLERPALLARIAELMRPGRSFISCFVVTELEKQLSERLQIPLLGTDPALGYWGSKAGSRELFARCGVPHPPGSPLVHNPDALAEAIAELWESHPQLNRCGSSSTRASAAKAMHRLTSLRLIWLGSAAPNGVGFCASPSTACPCPPPTGSP